MLLKNNAQQINHVRVTYSEVYVGEIIFLSKWHVYNPEDLSSSLTITVKAFTF